MEQQAGMRLVDEYGIQRLQLRLGSDQGQEQRKDQGKAQLDLV